MIGGGGLFRLFAYVTASVITSLGAVMVTQAVYDPENASAPFRVLGVMMIAAGLYLGGRVVANRE